MMVSERERNGYVANNDYDAMRNDRYSIRYGNEIGYEAERNRTSRSYRDSLYDSLERPASKSRLERADENRYGFYIANIAAGEKNYDKFWDAKHASENKVTPASTNEKRRFAFILTYVIIALVAVIAVTLAVLGTSSDTVVVSKTIEAEAVTATAEVGGKAAYNLESAAEIEEKATLPGGENYIMLANGEMFEVVMPENVAQAEEEENGFDKFCTWLNGVFGG